MIISSLSFLHWFDEFTFAPSNDVPIETLGDGGESWTVFGCFALRFSKVPYWLSLSNLTISLRSTELIQTRFKNGHVILHLKEQEYRWRTTNARPQSISLATISSWVSRRQATRKPLKPTRTGAALPLQWNCSCLPWVDVLVLMWSRF